VADKLLGWRQQRRKVGVRVHGSAVFTDVNQSMPVTGWAGPPSATPYYFVKVTNEGLRDVVVTHVWGDGQPRVDVLDPQRPLPTRLRPEQQWEAPIPPGGDSPHPRAPLCGAGAAVQPSRGAVHAGLGRAPQGGPMAGRGSPE
jgi:hypothetical protein